MYDNATCSKMFQSQNSNKDKNVWIKIFQPSLKSNVFSVNALQLKK